MSAKEYKTFIEMATDLSLQEKFKSMQLIEFGALQKMNILNCHKRLY